MMVILIAVFFIFNSNSIFTQATVSPKWNMEDIDATKNGNAIHSLYLLETNSNPTPFQASARDILTKPANYFGKYLQISGTVKIVQPYSLQNSILSFTIGNSSEIIMISSDNSAIIDCLVINSSGNNIYIGRNATIYGYTPGVRYVQNSQGAIITELVIIGRISS
jgi:hypothetical protein